MTFHRKLSEAIKKTKNLGEIQEKLTDTNDNADCAVVVIDSDGNPLAINHIGVVSMGDCFAVAIHTVERT